MPVERKSQLEKFYNLLSCKLDTHTGQFSLIKIQVQNVFPRIPRHFFLSQPGGWFLAINVQWLTTWRLMLTYRHYHKVVTALNSLRLNDRFFFFLMTTVLCRRCDLNKRKRLDTLTRKKKRFTTANNRVSVLSRLFIRSDMISFPIASDYFSSLIFQQNKCSPYCQIPLMV